VSRVLIWLRIVEMPLFFAELLYLFKHTDSAGTLLSGNFEYLGLFCNYLNIFANLQFF